MTNIQDFTDEQNRIDLPAYRRARREAGEDCWKCGGLIARPDGAPTVCWNCKVKDHRVPVDDVVIHCPQCQSAFQPDTPEVLFKGEHNFTCKTCSHSFVIKTSVSYTFEYLD